MSSGTGARDAVAQALLRAEDGQQPALVVGRVGAPHVVLGDGRAAQVVVVEHGVRVAGVDQGRRQRRLPDALRQPRAAGSDAEPSLQVGAHALELAEPVAVGQRRQDRLEVAAADDLDLAAGDERPQPLEERRLVGVEPLEQRPGVVQRHAHARMALERPDHRLVGALVDLVDDPAEVAHRLVVVEDQRERDARRHVGAARGTPSAAPAAGRLAAAAAPRLSAAGR